MLFGMFHRLHYRSIELFLHSTNICKSIQQQMQKKKQLQQPKRNAPSASSSNQEKFAAVQSRRLQPHTGACAIMQSQLTPIFIFLYHIFIFFFTKHAKNT